MRVLTITELLRLTRRELCELAAHIMADLPRCPDGSGEQATALTNLRNIRWVLARRVALSGPVL